MLRDAELHESCSYMAFAGRWGLIAGGRIAAELLQLALFRLRVGVLKGTGMAEYPGWRPHMNASKSLRVLAVKQQQHSFLDDDVSILDAGRR